MGMIPANEDLVSRVWQRLTVLGGIRARELDRFAV